MQCAVRTHRLPPILLCARHAPGYTSSCRAKCPAECCPYQPLRSLPQLSAGDARSHHQAKSRDGGDDDDAANLFHRSRIDGDDGNGGDARLPRSGC
eukprot:2789359-Rhodomonas_salina.1